MRRTLFLLGILLALSVATRRPCAADPASALTLAGAWTAPVQPAGRAYQAMAFDPPRQRMVLFGGWLDNVQGDFLANDLWTLSVGPNPQWRLLAAQGTPPSARMGHAMVYDSTHDRMLVFGGFLSHPGTMLADVWSLSLSGTPAWTKLAPLGPGPSPRAEHMQVYDPVRDRLIVYGGIDGSVHTLNDTWALELGGATPQWVAVPADTTAGITPRELGSMIYDPVNDRVLLFGGSGSVGASPADTWALNLSGAPAWTRLPVTGPPARWGAATAFDPIHDRMLVFGGANTGMFGDTWAFSVLGPPANWQQLLGPATRLASRYLCTGAFDPVGDRFLMFGGDSSVGAPFFADTWSLDMGAPAAWAPLATPPGRFSHALAFDNGGRRVVLFGGQGDGGALLNDAWTLDPAAGLWTPLTPLGTPPSPRAGASACVDAPHDRLVLFGGTTGGGRTNEAWGLFLGSPPTWVPIAAAGTPPPGLSGAATAVDPVHHRLVVAGGRGASGLFGGVWALSLDDTPTWTAFAEAGDIPAPRSEGSLLYDAARDRFLYFGGTLASGPAADTHVLALSAGAQWTALPAALPAGSTFAGTLDTRRDRVLAFGPSPTTTVYSVVRGMPLDLSTGWGALSPTGPAFPDTRTATGIVYDAFTDRAIVVDGAVRSQPLSDTWFLNFADQPVPTLTSLVDESVDGRAVHLAWFTPAGAGGTAAAERTPDGAAWTPLGTLVADASARLVLDDVVPADGRWGYRLRIGAAASPTEIAWLDTDSPGALAGLGATPNPSHGAPMLSFTLAATVGPARLEVHDVAGRHVYSRDVAALGPGAHTLDLRGEMTAHTGVYLATLRQGGVTMSRKFIVMP